MWYSCRHGKTLTSCFSSKSTKHTTHLLSSSSFFDAAVTRYVGSWSISTRESPFGFASPICSAKLRRVCKKIFMKELYKKAQKLENGPMSYKNNQLIIPSRGWCFMTLYFIRVRTLLSSWNFMTFSMNFSSLPIDLRFVCYFQKFSKLYLFTCFELLFLCFTVWNFMNFMTQLLLFMVYESR